MIKSRWWIGVLAFLSLVPGCTLHIGDGYYGDATLVADWSIEGSFDPDQCNAVGAVDLELVVRDRFGDFVLDAVIACEAMGMDISMDEGVYDLQFRLTDRRGRPVSDTLYVDRVRLRDYRDTEVSIDFDHASIL